MCNVQNVILSVLYCAAQHIALQSITQRWNLEFAATTTTNNSLATCHSMVHLVCSSGRRQTDRRLPAGSSHPGLGSPVRTPWLLNWFVNQLLLSRCVCLVSLDDVSPVLMKLSEEMRMLAAELPAVHPEIFMTCKCNPNTRHMVRGGADNKSV